MNSNDFVVGFDPTALTSITGAQLSTLVTTASPSSDRGLNLFTTDINGVPVIPDAVANPTYQRYTWIRLSPNNAAVVQYVWNPNVQTAIAYTPTGGSPASILSNWQTIANASIAAGSIQNYQLAGGITAANLAGGITTSQLASGSTFITGASNPASGNIGGSFNAGLNIQPLAITTGMIANGGITTPNILANSVTLAKFDNTGAVNTWLTNNAANTPLWNTIPSIVQNGSPVVTTANQYKVPQVATAGASDSGTWQMVTPAALISGITTASYTSALQSLTASSIVNLPHGFASIPTFVRAVIVCQNAELGYNINDEVDINTIIVRYNNTNPYAFPLGALMANANNLVFQFNLNFADGIWVNRITAVAGTSTAITPGNWKLKIYAHI